MVGVVYANKAYGGKSTHSINVTESYHFDESSYYSTPSLSPTWNNVGDKKRKSKRNVIMMISDGFGSTSETMARSYYNTLHSLPMTSSLPLDSILVGVSRTQSSSSLVTDSAAGATAFSCGIKSYNAAIAEDWKFFTHRPFAWRAGIRVFQRRQMPLCWMRRQWQYAEGS